MNYLEKIEAGKKQIETAQKQLVADVRALAKSKVKFWQAVPYFYLWSHPQYYFPGYANKDIFEKKVWTLGNVDIRLMSGEIFKQDSYYINEDDCIIQSSMNAVEWFFDGEAQIKRLYEEALYHKYNINAKWRQKIIKKYKIETPHTILLLL